MTVRVNGVAVSEQDWSSPQMAAVHELLRQRADGDDLWTGRV